MDSENVKQPRKVPNLKGLRDMIKRNSNHGMLFIYQTSRDNNIIGSSTSNENGKRMLVHAYG